MLLLLLDNWSHAGKLIQFVAPLSSELLIISAVLCHVFLALRCLLSMLCIASTLSFCELGWARVLTLQRQPILIRNNWHRLDYELFLLLLSTLPDFVCCEREGRIETLLFQLVCRRMLEKFSLQLRSTGLFELIQS